MTEQEIRKFVDDYVEAINSHNNDAIEKFHADDSISLSAEDPGHRLDREARRRYFEEREQAFPDAIMTVANIKVAPDCGSVTFDWTIRGTHKGAFKGRPPTHKEVTNRGTTELKIEDGKITQETSRQDPSTFMGQLDARKANEE